MFEILNQSTDRCLVVHFSGKPTGQEYQLFLDSLEGRLQKADELNLVLVLSGLQFYGDFEAFQKDYKFSRGEYKRIHRAALVGDQKWIVWYLRFIAPHTPTEEKHFAEGQIQAAVDWAVSAVPVSTP